MHTNTRKLRALMRRHKVDAAQVAEILKREVNTVRIWRMQATPRVIPNDALRLLELLLSSR